MDSISTSSTAASVADGLPIFHAIKVTNKAFVAGHPSQIVDLLVSGVATAVVKAKSNSNIPMFECLMRCPLLAPNTNLPVYFCLDSMNQPLRSEVGMVVLNLPTEEDEGRPLRGVIDEERARHWSSELSRAISFWEVKMEETVLSLYPNRTPKQADAYSSKGLLEMKVWPSLTDVDGFLSQCAKKNGFPSFKLSYSWIGSKEDPRSKEHLWGMKFDFSSYAQYPVVPRSRKPAVSAVEKQEQLMKKRKSSEPEQAAEELVNPPHL